MDEQKELAIGKTVIGTWEEEKGSGISYSVHYGNYLTPHRGGVFRHLSLDEYTAMLTAFLNSSRGSSYKKPTEAENINAIKIVAAREEAAIEKYAKEQSKEEQKPKEPEYIRGVIPEEISFAKQEDEKIVASLNDAEEKPSEKHPMQKDKSVAIYKRQVTILSFAVILLTLVVALQMLLNLYLLTR